VSRTGPGKQRVTVYVDRAVHREFQGMLQVRGVSFSQWVRQREERILRLSKEEVGKEGVGREEERGTTDGE